MLLGRFTSVENSTIPVRMDFVKNSSWPQNLGLLPTPCSEDNQNLSLA